MSTENKTIRPIEEIRSAVRAVIKNEHYKFGVNKLDERSYQKWSFKLEQLAVNTFMETERLFEAEQKALATMAESIANNDWDQASKNAIVANTCLNQRTIAVNTLRYIGADPVQNKITLDDLDSISDKSIILTWAVHNFPSLVIPSHPKEDSQESSDSAFRRGLMYGSQY